MMKVHDTGTFAAATVGRRMESVDAQKASAPATPAPTGGRLTLSSRIEDVARIREMALAAPEVREDVVAAAREALANGTLGAGLDSADLAGRILDDLGI